MFVEVHSEHKWFVVYIGLFHCLHWLAHVLDWIVFYIT